MYMVPTRAPFRRLRRWFRRRRNRALLVCVALVGLVVLSRALWLPLVGYWLAMPATQSLPASADAVAVFGGNHERLLYSIDLYNQGVASQLWETGRTDAPQPGQAALSSTLTLADHSVGAVREAGEAVPADAYYALPSTSTWEDAEVMVRFAREQGAQHIVAVTDWTHSRRAFCSLRYHLRGTDITVSYAVVPLDDTDTPIADWWQSPQGRRIVFHELRGLAYYAVRYGMPLWGCLRQ